MGRTLHVFYRDAAFREGITLHILTNMSLRPVSEAYLPPLYLMFGNTVSESLH